MRDASGKPNTPRGILICGAYGMRNVGDEAVLDAILSELREIAPERPVTVLTRSPAETRAAHHVETLHMFNIFGFLRVMRHSALYINGGGSLIQDVTSSRSLWYYLYTLIAAKRRGCKVMMYGCGVGPVNRPGNRRLAAWVINRCVDAVTLREEHSLQALRELGVTKPEVALACEPALSLSPAPEAEIDAIFSRYGLTKGQKYFCVCVRRWPGMRQKTELFAAAADYAYDRYGLTTVLLSVNQRQDVESATLVAAQVTSPSILVTEPMGVRQAIGFLSRMTVVMAMRLHALIFSASQAVPLIGISYDPKVAAFLDYIGQTNYLNFSDLTDPAQLQRLIDRAVAVDRQALRAATARILAAERRNTDTARRLLEEDDAL